MLVLLASVTEVEMDKVGSFTVSQPLPSPRAWD
jgi:hypothetical protein